MICSLQKDQVSEEQFQSVQKFLQDWEFSIIDHFKAKKCRFTCSTVDIRIVFLSLMIGGEIGLMVLASAAESVIGTTTVVEVEFCCKREVAGYWAIDSFVPISQSVEATEVTIFLTESCDD